MRTQLSKFLNIKYPVNLALFLEIFSLGRLNFVPTIPVLSDNLTAILQQTFTSMNLQDSFYIDLDQQFLCG